VSVSKPKKLTPQQIYARLQAPRDNLILLDVRTPREWQEEGHLEGAVLIPIGELQRRVGELPGDAEIIIYCHSGSRSRAAADFLARIGFDDVADMRGGLEEWGAGRLPVARD
jgi:rhodanese-related sulfurtransferase